MTLLGVEAVDAGGDQVHDRLDLLGASAWTPGSVLTSTEAVAGSCSSAKTCLGGSARCTTAVSTPSIASMVLESSPSIARLKSVCSWNCEVERPWLSSSE